MSKNLSVYRPVIKRQDLENVLNSMMEDKLNYGDYAREFEERLSDRVGCKHVIAINSYFNAIWLILEAMEVGEGDEVILPSFAPQIYLNIILLKKAKPILIDIEKEALKPSLEALQKVITEKTKACLLYYYFGYTYDSLPYYEIFPHIIEDISSIIGTNVFDIKKDLNCSYAVADFSVKSSITTGEGAAVFCPKKNLYKPIYSFLEIDYDLEYKPRFNCLMPDLNAAMGVTQDRSLKHRLILREKIGRILVEAVKKGHGTRLPQEEGSERIFNDFAIIVKSSLKEAIKFFKKNDIEAVRPFAYPLHQYLNLSKSDFPNTEYYYLHTLLVPMYSTLLNKDVELIAKVISSVI